MYQPRTSIYYQPPALPPRPMVTPSLQPPPKPAGSYHAPTRPDSQWSSSNCQNWNSQQQRCWQQPPEPPPPQQRYQQPPLEPPRSSYPLQQERRIEHSSVWGPIETTRLLEYQPPRPTPDPRYITF